MPKFLSQLTKSEQARRAELHEPRGDSRVLLGARDPVPDRGRVLERDVKATKDTDRKPIVLARVRRYLRTGQVGRPTCIPARIVREEKPPARLGPRDRLYYRWYAKEFEEVLRCCAS